MQFAATLTLLLLLGWTPTIFGQADSRQGQIQEPISDPQSEPKADTKERRLSTPRTFTPSEKISADSAVSFPVDI